MLYRQDAPFLRYEQIPVSSNCYNYSPRHATQPTELKKHGILWFSVPHNHLAMEILRIMQGEIWVSVNGTPHALYAGDLVFLNPFDIHATYVTAPDTLNEFHVINFDLPLLKTGAVPELDAYLESIEENTRTIQPLILHSDPRAAELNEKIQDIHTFYAERSTPAGVMRILAGLLDLMAALERNGFISSGGSEKSPNRQLSQKRLCSTSAGITRSRFRQPMLRIGSITASPIFAGASKPFSTNPLLIICIPTAFPLRAP